MRALRWLLAFFLLCIALRWGSYFISVINHDESTYIVIADEMLRGETYLKDVIDTKPIGIFWIYMAIIKLTGGSIVALRVAASFVVALGAWGLYFTGRRATGNERVGIAAGVIYCWICSIFTYYGLSPNTEIFFNTLTISAVALAVAPRIRQEANDPFWHWPVAGLLLGMAMVIKPFAAAESLAIGLFMVWFYGSRKQIGRMFNAGIALVGAFALPLAGLYFYYRNLGMMDEFLFYTFEVAEAYAIELPWYLRLKYMGDYLLRNSPLLILGGFALRQILARTQVQEEGLKSKEGAKWAWYLLLQFLTVTTVILLTGKRFGHYQIQLHPVIALFAACWWAEGLTIGRWLRGDKLRRWSTTIIAVLALALGTAHYFHYAKKKDMALMVANHLNQVLQPGEEYVCVNSHQISYHLTGHPVPTPYVHPSIVFLPSNQRAFGIDPTKEAERITSQPQVKYLVIKNLNQEEVKAPYLRSLSKHFIYLAPITSDTELWHRIKE
jgi:hypothetical protein